MKHKGRDIMKKMLASVLTLFVFCAAAPFTVLAAAPVNGDLTVDGVVVLTDGALGTISGTGWEYNETTNTLYLDNYDGGEIIGKSMEDFTIFIRGNNTVVGTEHGIDILHGSSDLTITGEDDAALTVTLIENVYWPAIFNEVGSLTIEGKIAVSGTSLLPGIGAQNDLIIKDGATVSASATFAFAGLYSMFGSIVISGSTVTASGPIGIQAAGAVAIDDSDVTAAATVGGNPSIGSNGGVSIFSGTVVAPQGIKSLGVVTIDGGSVVTENVDPTPVNGDGDVVELTKITLDGVAGDVLITSIDGTNIPNYGLDSVYTQDDGSVSLWLPAGATITSIEADGVVYEGTVEAGGSATFTEAGENPTPTPDPEPTPTPTPTPSPSPSPTPSPTPTPSPSPSPTPSETPTAPATGDTSVSSIALLGMMIIAGAGLLYVALRKREANR